MEYMQLLGTEDVQNAGRAMKQAAGEMSQAALQFNEDVSRFQRVVDEYKQAIYMLEQVLTEHRADTAGGPEK